MLLHTDKLSDWEKTALLSFLLTHATAEQRSAVSHALPQAYNKICGTDVMTVTVKRSDGFNGTAAAASPAVVAK